MKPLLAVLAALVLLLATRTAEAHKPSDSYLTLDVDGAVVHARWDIALRDLDYALDLDHDQNGKITWAEVSSETAAIEALAFGHLAVGGDAGACALAPAAEALRVVDHSDGTYAVLRRDLRCAARVHSLNVDYTLFFDIDPQHRAVTRIEAPGGGRTQILSRGEHDVRFELDGSGRARQLRNIVVEGIFHIWTGYDHILFLLALLLPSVLRREGTGWIPVLRLRPALLDVLRIVTSFTVAHSITLSLAALGVVTLPSRLVESVIAASVVLAAVNNLRPVLGHDRWMAAFLLGLMHGFAFSATLSDLDLPRSNLLVTLFGFNAGVELGQLAIVALFVPLAFAARRAPAYRRWGLRAGSVAIALLATVWLVERAFALKIIS
ncbi:MAG: putative rane protein [Labilithrix sp.]|nr:putative rane protein [Labilithrix sp.]